MMTKLRRWKEAKKANIDTRNPFLILADENKQLKRAVWFHNITSFVLIILMIITMYLTFNLLKNIENELYQEQAKSARLQTRLNELEGVRGKIIEAVKNERRCPQDLAAYIADTLLKASL